MDRLNKKLHELYFREAQQTSAWPAMTVSVSGNGLTRVMVLGFEKSADWASVAKVYEAVRQELKLPLPAVSVSHSAGFKLWFSLEVPLAVAEAAAFLKALVARYLADLPASNLMFYPVGASDDTKSSAEIELVPARCEKNGKWSAFIDPSLGSMFIEEAGLDLPPNFERQADLLSALQRITADEWRYALSILLAKSRPENVGEADAEVCVVPASRLSISGNFNDPRSFLMAVMNDASASAQIRVDAAKALLPYIG